MCGELYLIYATSCIVDYGSSLQNKQTNPQLDPQSTTKQSVYKPLHMVTDVGWRNAVLDHVEHIFPRVPHDFLHQYMIKRIITD